MKKVTSYKSYELRVKSCFLTLFLLSAFCLLPSTLNAQWFLGGGIGFNLSVEKSKFSSATYNQTNNQTYVGFALAPKMGYGFNNKIALGLNGYAGTNFTVDLGYAIIWGLNPVIRFTPFTYKNFSLILEGGPAVGGAYYFWKLGVNKTKDISKTLAIGVFNITPILGFKITEHLQLEAEIQFLSIGYNIDITETVLGKINEGNFAAKNITHSFNIGFNSSSILAMTQLRVGIIYKFNKKGDKL